jgi:hypothetical protein
MAAVSAANFGVFVILSEAKNLRSFSYRRAREPNSQRRFAWLNMTGGPGGRDVAKKTSCASALIMLISAS